MGKDPKMDETRKDVAREDEAWEDEGVELTEDQLEGVAGGGTVIELPEDSC